MEFEWTFLRTYNEINRARKIGFLRILNRELLQIVYELCIFF